VSQTLPRPPAGFTLVELLIGTTLSGIVMAAVLSSYIFLGRSFTRLANQQILETEARRALTYFANDVEVASGLAVVATAPTSPSASRVDFTVPTGAGTNTITYYYNSTATDANVTVNGASTTMAANTLTRCVYDGTTVSSQILLRNITDNNAGTTADLTIRYYDSSGNPYTSYTDYLPGIRQLSLEFSTQLGVSSNGTQTQVYWVATGRMQIHNAPLLQ
jgi:prepilin-type N-terminal cleavage/methylation domain-containing protein